MDAECLLPREGLKLGSGGFAVVYKGILGSRKVAVKKLSGANDMDEKQFIKEIECLMKVRHKNIVRFLGYCADTQGLLQDFGGKSILADVRNRALCFEYVPKGSLDKYITDVSCGLEWTVRYKIIKGICQGLHYLHKNQILHLDLKPANILVDDNMIPKIADFGLSRLLDQNQSMIIATTVMGSLGYFAPECYDREFSKKSDVYSLGVVIMEIMSGKKFPTPKDVIASWTNRREKSQEDIPLEHVKSCAGIGARCINHIAEERPTTQHIIKVLKDLGGTDEFKEAGSSNSLESQMDEKTRIAYGVLKRMLFDESEEPKELPLSLLEAITNNFSDELELSRAGFAVVYKGMLGTRTVSVKKLSGIDMNENQFNKEVQCLMKVFKIGYYASSTCPMGVSTNISLMHLVDLNGRCDMK
ncbi:hypothetical protein QOZ80_3BG0268200 [Eleusine coracana subsp. coracana]|nr:hypothetical protein QOZ80_3BG0268200 [Eleusine coracana subsp. coracana]